MSKRGAIVLIVVMVFVFGVFGGIFHEMTVEDRNRVRRRLSGAEVSAMIIYILIRFIDALGMYRTAWRLVVWQVGREQARCVNAKS